MVICRFPGKPAWPCLRFLPPKRSSLLLPHTAKPQLFFLPVLTAFFFFLFIICSTLVLLAARLPCTCSFQPIHHRALCIVQTCQLCEIFWGRNGNIGDNIIHKSSHHPSKYTNCAILCRRHIRLPGSSLAQIGSLAQNCSCKSRLVTRLSDLNCPLKNMLRKSSNFGDFILILDGLCTLLFVRATASLCLPPCAGVDITCAPKNGCLDEWYFLISF